ncbi:MAG: phage portal protein [Paenibacillus dendritiformis]|uniref:phage portal protein n=1 Tax=uncultured Paenibacillus sp. TaxID=227322 RepID=UPI0025D51664|nr:phage portal protein [uncultured Paenibacillus sp.]MDU5141074.1 phage portal protein [Paenibacillus dendritiformis]
MIKVRPDTPITPEVVGKIIERFKRDDLPRLQRLRKYYLVKNDILSRTVNDEKPNNKLAHGLAKYIAKMATGFFMGEGIRVSTPDEAYKEQLDELLKDGATGDPSFEIAKEMAITGEAFEILYINESADLRSVRFPAEEVIPVYSLSVGEFLEFAVRIYVEEDLLTDNKVDYAEVYTKSEVITYRGTEGRYAEVDRRTHALNDVPVVIYWNNEERKGDFEDVITLADAYDKSQSDTLNDFEYFTDAYLVIVGAGGGIVGSDPESEEDEKAIRTLKRDRILFLDEKGQADWLIKQINDTAVENFKNRLRNDIFFLSQVPALSDESFAGNLSGVALRYKLFGLEQLAAEKEKRFLPAYRKKLRMLTDYINTRYNTNYKASAVKVTFDRNTIDNLLDLANVVALLDGKVSKETLLQLLPFVKDAKEELKRLFKEIADIEGIPMADEEEALRLAGVTNGGPDE